MLKINHFQRYLEQCHYRLQAIQESRRRRSGFNELSKKLDHFIIWYNYDIYDLKMGQLFWNGCHKNDREPLEQCVNTTRAQENIDNNSF